VRQAEAEACFWKEHGRLASPEELYGTAKPQGKVVRGKRASRQLDDSLQFLQDKLCEALGVSVKITGETGKGTVSIGYATVSQLAEISRLLGVETGI
jgi:ParB family transcriptional regulator, chromosome partitioning protein